jgi:Uma2 family endonuclease
MGHALKHRLTSPQDYLAAEEQAMHKHEYVQGEVYAMAGASERHNRIALNIAFHLRAATRGSPCRAFMADMKLRVAAHDAFYYPDAMLVCDPDDAHPIYKTTPCFIAEVMSPATASIDQREKLLAYRALPSLRYYLLTDSERVYARLYSREADGAWYQRELDASDSLTLRCGPCEIPLCLDDLYEDTGLLVP